MTQNDNGPGPGRNYGETAVLHSAEKWLLAKNAFYPKKALEIPYETDIYFGKGYFL